MAKLQNEPWIKHNMTYQATEKYIRTSTRKVRLVADSIRKLTPTKAIERLAVTPKKAAIPLIKAINSALTNAKAKGVAAENTVFSKIEIMEAGGMKRFHAASRGQAWPYKKRMTHIRIIVSEKGTA